MKPILLLMAACVLSGQTPGTLPQGDRDFAISYFEASRKTFFDAITGLTPAQWSYKPAGGGWSVAECAEHLVVSEDALYGLITEKLLKLPPGTEPAMTRADDQKVITRLTDRSAKAKAPEMLVPSGKYPTPESVKEAFSPRRNRFVSFTRSTQDNLRARRSNGMDAYQYLLMVSAHTMRHTEQINEVKASAGYPKE